jgi:hypothetical protein
MPRDFAQVSNLPTVEDGAVPEGHLRMPAQAYQDVMAWLERLDAGEVEVISRPRIVVPLLDTDPADAKRHPLTLPSPP